jgi:hypothetical protein
MWVGKTRLDETTYEEVKNDWTKDYT